MSNFSSDHSSPQHLFSAISRKESDTYASAPLEKTARMKKGENRSIGLPGGRLGGYLCTVFFFVTLIPLVIVFSLQYRELCQSQVSDIQKNLIQASQAIKSDINRVIINGFESLDHLSTHPDLIRWVERKEPLTEPDDPMLTFIIHEARIFGFESIIVTDASGHILLPLPLSENEHSKVLFGSFRLKDWANIATKMVEERGRYISPPLVPGTYHKNVFAYVCLPVKDALGNIIGTITGGIKRSLMYDSIVNHSALLYPGLQQEVLNDDFQKCLGVNGPDSPVSFSVESRGPVSQNNDEWGQGFLIFRNNQGNKFVGIRDKLKSFNARGNPWFIHTAAPLAIVFEKRKSLQYRAFIFTGVAVGLSLFIAGMLAHGTTRVIRQYLAWARLMARGDVTTLSCPQGNHEIAELGKELSEFSQRMTHLIRFASSASMGNFGQSFPVLGERDVLGHTINGIRNYFLTILESVRALSHGKYSQKIPDGHPRDELSPLLKKLSEALNLMDEDNMRQITASLAQVELVRKISENWPLDAMIDQLLSFFCQYLKAEIGVFYVQDPETEVFIRIGTYGALDTFFPERLHPGDGLCGQAVIEKTHLLVAPKPEQAPSFSNGLTRKPARNILAFPFVLRDEVIGVMELGGIEEIKVDYLKFIKQNNESIAIGIHSSLARQLTESLLIKTMEQSKRLTANQEKLSKANRELAEQTEALKKSESRLMAREEELKKANQDLEVRSRQLEEQKNFLNQNNRELFETKSILEVKAEELTRSNRYKSEFLANMSHELRTPLNSIILLSKLLQDKLGDLETSQGQNIKFAQIINTSGKELLHLIDEVLDLTRVTSGDMEVNSERYEFYDLAKVMRFWYDKHIMEKSVTFDVKLGPHLPDDIVTDPQKLERILKCLMSNAFKYTEKGSVIMEIKRPSPDMDLDAISLEHDSTVEFSIADTGQGIPEDKQRLVFDAFRQVDGSMTRKHGGAGLGLSLAQEFARLLGGEIFLMHSSEKGSVFSLFLPDNPLLGP